MQWDMAGDARRRSRRGSAPRASRRAGGYAALGVDLARFAGAQPALERLQSLVAGEKDSERAGAIAAEAARASLAIGAPARALELAETALAKNPLVADAIEIAERGAIAAGRVRDLSRVYDALGARARGRFGRRAAHYRGARFFDQRGESDLALKHAALAFAAVPVGGRNVLPARAHRRAHGRLELRRAHDRGGRRRVAEGRHPRRVAARARRRSPAAATKARACASTCCSRPRSCQPMPSTLALLGDAARDLLARMPEERPVLQVRFAKASHALARKLEGPDGARVALAFTTLALELFDDVDDALASLDRALDSDADLEEYVLLLPHAAALAKGADARAVVARGVALLDKPFSNVGVSALPLARRDRRRRGRRGGRGAHAAWPRPSARATTTSSCARRISRREARPAPRASASRRR